MPNKRKTYKYSTRKKIAVRNLERSHVAASQTPERKRRQQLTETIVFSNKVGYYL